MASRLGEMLVKAQLITEAQLEEAINLQRREGGKLGSIVVRLGFCADQDIVSFLGMQYGVPAADLDQWPPIEPAVIALVPAELANKHKVLPLQRSGNVLTMAMSDPTDIFAMDDVRFHTGYNIDPVVSSEMGLVRAIERYYGGSSALRCGKEGNRPTESRPGVPAAEEHVGPGQRDAAVRGGAEEALDLKGLEEELSGGRDRIREARRRGAHQRLGPGQGQRGGPRGAPGEHGAHRRHPQGRLRHPYRALREDLPDPVPHRRPAAGGDAAQHQAEGPGHLPGEDPGQAQHRREAPAPGRPHQAAGQPGRPAEGHRLPGEHPAHPVRREDRAAAAGLGQAHARPHQAGLRAGEPDAVGPPDLQAVRDGAGDRPHRFRQDQHAVLLHRQAEHRST